MKYRVAMAPGDDRGHLVEADHHRLDTGGSLALFDGDVFAPRLVRLYAPGGWHHLDPEPPADPDRCPECGGAGTRRHSVVCPTRAVTGLES